MKFALPAIIALIIVVGLIAAKLHIDTTKRVKAPVTENIKHESAPPLPSETYESEVSSSTPSPGKVSAKGIIEGSLSYPSEEIPENMAVCAESDATDQTICTNKKITDKKYTYGKGYTLEVPAGSYFVYAKIPDREYYAYYSEFVTCGLLASCTNHTPIEVEVKANQTVSKIDPQDWYNIQPSL